MDQKRIAVVDRERCKPEKCQQECLRACVVNSSGKECLTLKPRAVPGIDIEEIRLVPVVERKPKMVADIAEKLCIGCGACVKVCPFKAIKIVNLIHENPGKILFQYGQNTFRLYRMVLPKKGQILGLLGSNGVGKSTILRLLSDQVRPNFGDFSKPTDQKEILAHFRGNTLHGYLNGLYQQQFQPVIKPQEIENLRDQILLSNGGSAKPTIQEWLQNTDLYRVNPHKYEEIWSTLNLETLKDRLLDERLSGGELQRVILAHTLLQSSRAYLIDEASAYLDIVQRLKMCHLIHGLKDGADYVVVIEHDLVVLDYLADFLNIVWGEPGAYGIVGSPISTLEGINQYLDGYLRAENLRLRPEGLNFRTTDTPSSVSILPSNNERVTGSLTSYPSFRLQAGPPDPEQGSSFTLEVTGGTVNEGEIVVLLGENGTGKTSLVKVLADQLEKEVTLSSLDGEEIKVSTGLQVSYKPQNLQPKYQGTVESLLQRSLGSRFYGTTFQSEVVQPLEIERLLPCLVPDLSGGERQRLAITLALGKPAHLYLLDEPSAYLDSEQRLRVAKAIKRFMVSNRSACFLVEHDFMMANYLADKVIIYSGIPGVKAQASAPIEPGVGINQFLASVGVTFRHDSQNGRPRVNKANSAKDKEQRARGCYWSRG